MRWRTLGLIQLWILLAHLSASPFGVFYIGWRAPDSEHGYRIAQTVADTAVYSVEEKASRSVFSVSAKRPEVILLNPLAPRPSAGALAVLEKTKTLDGFRLQVCERPPPSRL